MVFCNFEKIISQLLSLYNDSKLHHAILIDGKEGIGKASFSLEFVAQILESNNINHPNLLIISKDDKKEIGVEKIRQISDFVNKSAATNNDKFIIIDSACQLNKSAANALLKNLEEPRSGNYLILICHNIGKILPTILSRCYIVKSEALSLKDFISATKGYNAKLDENQIKFLNEICDGSVALLLSEGNSLIKIYQLLLSSFITNKLDDELLKIASDKNFNFTIFALIIEFFISRLLKYVSNYEK